MTENEEKKLKKVREKIAQLKVQERSITLRDKKRQRKEKTSRLIQNGTLAEKYLNCENMNPQEFEKVLKTIMEFPFVTRIVEQIKKSLL